MINFDHVWREKIKEHNPNWPQNRILIIGGSISGKINTLLTLTNHNPDINKNYLNTEDPYEAKYQLLINKHESVRFKIL